MFFEQEQVTAVRGRWGRGKQRGFKDASCGRGEKGHSAGSVTLYIPRCARLNIRFDDRLKLAAISEFQISPLNELDS